MLKMNLKLKNFTFRAKRLFGREYHNDLYAKWKQGKSIWFEISFTCYKQDFVPETITKAEELNKTFMEKTQQRCILQDGWS